MVAVDYSQIELRIMAHLSQDKALIAAFSKDEEDIHRSTAAIVFGVAPKEVTSDQRRKAKAINFGLMYGMSSFGLAKQLGIDRAEAERYSNGYFKAFPGVKLFMDNIKKSALENGFVETLAGRRLYLPDLKASQAMVRKAAERAAINAPMQGTNADIIKLAMIELSRWFKENKLSSRLIMQVHDELIFEVHGSELDRVVEYIKTTMENLTPLSVPLKVSVGIGNNWDEAH
jgi:DNA polymerase-1